MPEITIISALADNRVIGIDNTLPWYLPADLIHFKNYTMGKPMIMGRKTWESLPGILPGRPHIVITRDLNYDAGQATVVHSLEQAISTASNNEEVMIVGGANLYQQALEIAHKMLLTEIHTQVEGDTYFPGFEQPPWQETERETHQSDSANPYAYDFVTYRKTKA